MSEDVDSPQPSKLAKYSSNSDLEQVTLSMMSAMVLRMMDETKQMRERERTAEAEVCRLKVELERAEAARQLPLPVQVAAEHAQAARLPMLAAERTQQRDVSAQFSTAVMEAGAQICELNSHADIQRVLKEPAPPLTLRPPVYSHFNTFNLRQTTIDSLKASEDGSECLIFSSILALLSDKIGFPKPLDSKQVWGSYYYQHLTGFVWLQLSREYRIEVSRSQYDADCASHRPDEWVIMDRCLVLKGEHKGHYSHFEEAKRLLTSKMVEWNPIIMHGLHFLPCYAAAGHRFQFFVIDQSMQLLPISEEFNLCNIDHRFAAFVASIKLFQTVFSFRPRIYKSYSTYHSPILYFRMVQEVCFGTNRNGALSYVEVTPTHVIKKCFPAVDLGVYDLLTQITDHAVQVSIMPEGRDLNGYEYLQVTPVCSIKPPSTVDELKNAVRSVLCALAVLHDNGFIHRDVQLPNVLCSATHHWLLADFELSSRIGDPLPKQYLKCVQFSPEVRAGEPCTTALDIWQVGQLVQHWAVDHIFRPQPREAAEEFVNFLCVDDASSRPDARAALNHPYLLS